MANDHTQWIVSMQSSAEQQSCDVSATARGDSTEDMLHRLEYMESHFGTEPMRAFEPRSWTIGIIERLPDVLLCSRRQSVIFNIDLHNPQHSFIVLKIAPKLNDYIILSPTILGADRQVACGVDFVQSMVVEIAAPTSLYSLLLDHHSNVLYGSNTQSILYARKTLAWLIRKTRCPSMADALIEDLASCSPFRYEDLLQDHLHFETPQSESDLKAALDLIQRMDPRVSRHPVERDLNSVMENAGISQPYCQVAFQCKRHATPGIRWVDRGGIIAESASVPMVGACLAACKSMKRPKHKDYLPVTSVISTCVTQPYQGQGIGSTFVSNIIKAGGDRPCFANVPLETAYRHATRMLRKFTVHQKLWNNLQENGAEWLRLRLELPEFHHIPIKP